MNFNTSPDPLVAVAATLVPSEDVLDEWNVAKMDQVLAGILDDAVRPASPSPVGRRRRVVVTAAVAACAAVAAVAVPLLLPSGSPGGSDSAEAAVEHLAVLADAGPTLGPNQFAYRRMTVEVPLHSSLGLLTDPDPESDLNRDTYELWTSPNGDFWYYPLSRVPHCLAKYAYVPQHESEDGYLEIPPADIAALPTDVDALSAYLEAHAPSDHPHAYYVFQVLGSVVSSGLASPELRATAIQVLAQTDGVEVDPHATDSTGRPAIRLAHSLGGPSSVDLAIYFDPETSNVLERDFTTDGTFLRDVITGTAIVDSVPTDLPHCTP